MNIKNLLAPDVYRRLKELKEHIDTNSSRQLLYKNIEYKNKHKGQRCFILGNGPSVNALDFSKLRDEIVFTVNQLPRNPQFASICTNYHFWADRIFFEIHEDRPEELELLDVMKSVNTGGNKPVVFYEITAKPMVDKYGLDENLTVAYYRSVSLALNIMLKKKLDFTYSVPNFPTVVHYAICMAVYMGFSEIYLLGCDCTGFINTAKNKLSLGNETFYGYQISENERKRMELASKQRPIKEELASYVNILDGYGLLYDYCRRNHVKLWNATEGSLLETVPKVKLNRIIGD